MWNNGENAEYDTENLSTWYYLACNSHPKHKDRSRLWIFALFEWRFNLLWKINLIIIILVNGVVLYFLYGSQQGSRDFRESSLLWIYYQYRVYLYQHTFHENCNLKQIWGDLDAIFHFSHAQLNSSGSPEPVGLPWKKNWLLLPSSESNLSKQKVRAEWFVQFLRSSQQQHI